MPNVEAKGRAACGASPWSGVLGADARKSAKARNPRPAQKAAAADEETETQRARDGAEGRNEARRCEPVGDRPTERQPDGRDGARKSALARRHGREKWAGMDGNGLTCSLRGWPIAGAARSWTVPLEVVVGCYANLFTSTCLLCAICCLAHGIFIPSTR